MEKRVKSLVFRNMTYADFRHINKTGGEEKGGGGQSYIDFPISEVNLSNWINFLGEPNDLGAERRPIWYFRINSLGLKQPISLKIYQRRPASVCIASQKLHSRESNRVPSWHPTNGFPEDYNPESQKLIVYIIQTIDNEYWAGWTLNDPLSNHLAMNTSLKRMLEEPAGYIEFQKKIFIDTTNSTWPFYFEANLIQNLRPTDDDIEFERELEDISPKLQELIDNQSKPEVLSKVVKIRQRKNIIVKNLKKLYNGKCQITGEELTFKKASGEFYCELHHLIPLGEDGSDSYANAIIVSPLIHRMLHYAVVSPIDLNKIKDFKLDIEINGKTYQITWHPDHFSVIESELA